MDKTTVHCHSLAFDGQLADFQDLVRAGKTDRAVRLLAGVSKMSSDWAQREVEREADFLRTLDASYSIGAERSRSGLNPRQALIMAALVGWCGDKPCSWQSPVDRSTLLAWAESHYQGPAADLEIALDALVLQGLFFDIHPAVFASTCYYCSFDSEFLAEVPHEAEDANFWSSLSEDYNEEYGFTWLKTGLCAGQGSQGPSDAPWGPCVGSSCVCFRSGAERCNWGLQYNPGIKPPSLPNVG